MIDRFTYQNLEILEKVDQKSEKTLEDLVRAIALSLFFFFFFSSSCPNHRHRGIAHLNQFVTFFPFFFPFLFFFL